MQERLQKIISRVGLASRRAGEDLILAGRVRVNGRIVTELGAKADLRKDDIEVDGRKLVPEAPRYLVLHKPRGVVSTLSDPENRPTVKGLLTEAGTRLYPVGRLDFATSGVLLVTNDGEFANGLLHPRGGVPKTYVVKVNGLMSDNDLERWEKGIELEDGKTRPAEVRLIRHEEDKTWFEVTLREGRNQQIRRMGLASGFPVMRLSRTSFAGITSEGLRPGQWRPLTVDELMKLREQFGVPRRIRGAVVDGPPAGRVWNAKGTDRRPRRGSEARTVDNPSPTRAPRRTPGFAQSGESRPSARERTQTVERSSSLDRRRAPKKTDGPPRETSRGRRAGRPSPSRGKA